MDSIGLCRFDIEGFIYRKGKIIKDLTGVDYITEKDESELKKWQDSDILIVANKFYKGKGDTDVCPWCLLFIYKHGNKGGCIECTYGKRHGRC